jgi:hypothetical protein
MRQAIPTLALLAALAASGPASAGRYNRIYLVPALKECPGPASCVPREFESSYTFEAIVLGTPSGKYTPSGKPLLVFDVRGVRDRSGGLVSGNLTLRIMSGRVSLPGFGTFPDDSSLTQVAPVPIPIKNGSVKKFPYKPSVDIPNGTITNGGGAEILDPEGKRLAVTGSQAKP